MEGLQQGLPGEVGDGYHQRCLAEFASYPTEDLAGRNGSKRTAVRALDRVVAQELAIASIQHRFDSFDQAQICSVWMLSDDNVSWRGRPVMICPGINHDFVPRLQQRKH